MLKMVMKRVIALILCLATVTVSVMYGKLEAKADTGWVMNEENGKIHAEYNGAEKNLVVPDGVQVLEYIPETVETLHLSGSVETIYLYSLLYYSALPHLKEITVSENSKAFLSVNGVLFDKARQVLYLYPADKSGDTYRVPEGTRVISEFAIRNNHLKSIQFPSSVYAIGRAAISSEKLTELYLSAGVREIADGAFASTEGGGIESPMAYNPKLEKITVASSNKYYSSVNGVLFNKKKNKLMVYPSGKKGGKYTIPSGVKEVMDFAFFQNKYLKILNLPSKKVTETSFYMSDIYSNKITKIHIPKNYEGIIILRHITSLQKITVDKKNKIYKSVNGVLYNKKVKKLYCYPHAKKTKKYSIPKTVTSISERAALSNPYMQELVLHTKFKFSKEADSMPFESFPTKLKNIKIKGKNPNYSTVNGVLFDKKKAKLLVYPAGRKAKSYTVPSTVTKLNDAVFYHNKYIKTVKLPNKVNQFADLGRDIYNDEFGNNIGEKGIAQYYKNITLKVKKGSLTHSWVEKLGLQYTF